MFHLFSSLAPELRHNIWRLALPENIGPALHFYQGEGYWRLRYLEEHESTYRPGYRDEEIEFRTELIDPEVELCLPQFFVNHEAHDIAAAWLRQQRDTLYIPQDKWDQFNFEPNERLLQRDEDSVPGVDVVHKAITFALPEAVFWDLNELRCLPGVKNMWFDDPGRLIVIMGVQPERIASTAEHDIWSWWEMEGTQMGALVWDMVRREFVFEQGAETLDEEHVALFARMEEAARVGLRESMIKNACQTCETLEIRLAYAVRRQGL
ncbi:hypothetical protein E4U12_003637 [Claviceps purpurea]|nr:hypothetical protein E4U12_003637 [Claviceps purpurea]